MRLPNAGCASLSDSQSKGGGVGLSLTSRSRIDLSPTYRPVVNSSTAVTAHWPPVSCCLSVLLQPEARSLASHQFVDEGLIQQWSQMPEPEWMALVKCGFGVYERRSLLLCSSCSVNYYDYCELSTSCDCCSQSAGNNQQRSISQLTRLNHHCAVIHTAFNSDYLWRGLPLLNSLHIYLSFLVSKILKKYCFVGQ